MILLTAEFITDENVSTTLRYDGDFDITGGNLVCKCLENGMGRDVWKFLPIVVSYRCDMHEMKYIECVKRGTATTKSSMRSLIVMDAMCDLRESDNR